MCVGVGEHVAGWLRTSSENRARYPLRDTALQLHGTRSAILCPQHDAGRSRGSSHNCRVFQYKSVPVQTRRIASFHPTCVLPWLCAIRVTTADVFMRSVDLEFHCFGGPVLTLWWQNWCGAKPGGLSLRVALPHDGGAIMAPLHPEGPESDIRAAACADASQPSTLQIMAAYGTTK